MPRALLLVFLPLCLAVLPARGAELREEFTDATQWQSIYDYQERRAFDTYGPPLPEDAPRFQAETQLYLDMIQNFYVISADEDDFAFVAEAFSVPVEKFRPASFRPGDILTGAASYDVFDDDPLPENYKSTSYYVDTIRPSFVPGTPFQPRSIDDVKLGEVDIPRSLFYEEPKKVEKPAEADEKDKEADAKKEAEKKAAEAAAREESLPAGRINGPKKVVPGSDEETLQALRQAVQELGLEKQLNLEPNPINKRLQATDAADKTAEEKKEKAASEKTVPVKPAMADTPKPVQAERKPALKKQPKPVRKKKAAAKKTEPKKDGGVVQYAPVAPPPAPAAPASPPANENPGGIDITPDWSLKKSF